jgi:ABC-type oligopeptide transport system substrate-binding subunit
MQSFRAVVGALTIILATIAPKPGEAENVLRWASATEALSFDPHAANHTPTVAAVSQVYEGLVDFNSSYQRQLAAAYRHLERCAPSVTVVSSPRERLPRARLGLGPGTGLG